MASACLVVFCGLPGAGKSTFAAKLVDVLANPFKKYGFLFSRDSFDAELEGKEHRENEVMSFLAGCHVLSICFDDIIPENLYMDAGTVNKYNISEERTWKSYRRRIAEFVDKFLRIHCNFTSKSNFLDNEEFTKSKEWKYVDDRIKPESFCPCRGDFIKQKRCDCGAKHIILLDDNMFYSSMRYKYYQIARKYICGFVQIHVSGDKDNIKKQNSQRAAVISSETIEHMSSVFEVPNPQQNSWEENLVEVNPENADFESQMYKVLQMIVYSLGSPAPALEKEDAFAKEKAKEISLKSILHQADQVLRKNISSTIKNLQGLKASRECLQTQSSTLNSKKKSFLDALKRSNETLAILDDLLLCYHGTNLNPAALKGNDIGKLDSRKSEMPTLEGKGTSVGVFGGTQFLNSKERFDFTVVNLFRDFNGEKLP